MKKDRKSETTTKYDKDELSNITKKTKIEKWGNKYDKENLSNIMNKWKTEASEKTWKYEKDNV